MKTSTGQTPEPLVPIEVLYSYMDEDKKFLTEIKKRLSPLQQKGVITSWQREAIPPGSNWLEETNTHLEEAKVILLLISPDFLASPHRTEIEMTRALERDKAKEACVIPILLRPVTWQTAPFSHLKVLPTNQKPITSWKNQDKAFDNADTGIRKVIKNLSSPSHPTVEKQDRNHVLPTVEKTTQTASPPKPAKSSQRQGKKGMLIALLTIPIVFAMLLGGVFITSHKNPSPTLPDTGIGIIQPVNGQDPGLGICNGSCVLDVNRLDGNLKNEAAANFTTHPDLAAQYWDWAEQDDMTDAEPKIFAEDQTVLASHKPYKIFIVAVPFPMSQDEATALSKHDASPLARALTTPSSLDDMNSIYSGRDILQGAYVQQKEYNDSHSNMQVYLLIANIGSLSSLNITSNQQAVANQIRQAIHADPRIVGVVGLPFGSNDLINALSQANIPMVSIAPAEYDSGNQYLLSVAPSISDEAAAAASYIGNTLHFEHVFVAYASDSKYSQYSAKLAKAFINAFATIAPLSSINPYPGGSTSDIERIARQAVNDQVDAIYIVGPYTDANTLLADLHTMNSQIVVMGGDSTYQSIHAPDTMRANFTGMLFTAFAFADEWHIQGLSTPPFIQDYWKDYDPDKKHAGNPYTYSKADSDTILSYDAMSLLTSASDVVLQKGLTLTSETLLKALRQFTPNHKLQGVSGQISFEVNNSVPYKKAILMLSIQSGGSKSLVVQSGSYR